MDDQFELNIAIEDDGRTARATVPATFDRTDFDEKVCESTLMANNIELTPRAKQLVKAFVQKVKATTAGEVSDTIAVATEPVHGEDGWIEWTIDQDDDKQSPADSAQARQPDDEDTSPVSHYDNTTYTIVKKGQQLGVIHRATPCEDGRDVTGKTIPARQGKEPEFSPDETIMVGKGDTIIANADGVLDRSGKTCSILNTIDVAEYVDFHTGNIDFDGSVVVHKGVRDCFRVKATGDIEVCGLIEAATIIAGGELRALGGFAGREQGTADVGGDLKARYLDAVNVNCQGDLCVDREIINCTTTVRGRIDSPRGAIIGGNTQVTQGLEIAEIGASGLPVTTVQVGVVPHLDPLISKLAGIVDDLIEDRQKLVEEQETIEKASGARTTGAHKERLCELMYRIAEVQTHLDRAEPSLERTREKADTMRTVEVNVQKTIHPNAVLVCNGLRYRIKNPLKGPLRIFMDGRGKLQLQYDGGKPSMLAKEADLGEAA